MLAHANNGEGIAGRTTFQKMIFILQNKPPWTKLKYSFIPHDYGPYSQELQVDIDDLIASGLLRELHYHSSACTMPIPSQWNYLVGLRSPRRDWC
jgi:uncharacterized protein YwgA